MSAIAKVNEGRPVWHPLPFVFTWPGVHRHAYAQNNTNTLGANSLLGSVSSSVVTTRNLVGRGVGTAIASNSSIIIWSTTSDAPVGSGVSVPVGSSVFNPVGGSICRGWSSTMMATVSSSSGSKDGEGVGSSWPSWRSCS